MRVSCGPLQEPLTRFDAGTENAPPETSLEETAVQRTHLARSVTPAFLAVVLAGFPSLESTAGGAENAAAPVACPLP